jgi:hypothetical protein
MIDADDKQDILIGKPKRKKKRFLFFFQIIKIINLKL